MSLGMRSGVNCMREKRQVQRLGHGLHQQRLGQPRHAHQQRVAAGQQRRDQIVHDGVLAHDAPRDLRLEIAVRAGQLRQQFQIAGVAGVAMALAGVGQGDELEKLTPGPRGRYTRGAPPPPSGAPGAAP